MTQKIINIPRINDSIEDFTKLFYICDQVKARFEDVKFTFEGCEFLRPNAVAFLGGLARWVEYRMGSIEFDWNTLTNSWLKTNLCQNGFAGAFAYPSPPWDGNSIPYREDKDCDPHSVMDYLEHHWIGRKWLNISPKLMNAILGRVWEIYNNAFEHSDSSIGVFSCGQYFKHRNELTLCVIDFGMGIPAKIRHFLKADPRAMSLQASLCLEWAFKKGKTTKVDEPPGGMGLGLLKDFISLNQGKLEIYSNEGYAIIDKNGERYTNCNSSFEGTVVYITLMCDELLYSFKEEV